MPKPWDEAMKRLARLNPHALLKWFLPGAVFVREMPLELELTEFDVDVLLLVQWNGAEMLLHIEFQTANDYKMANRTLRYNVLARCEHKRPVLSIVIYLFQDGNTPASSLYWEVPTGQKVLEFYFISIKLWEMSVDDLLNLDHVGLLPLIPLTRDGARQVPVERMLTALDAAGDADLLFLGYNLATLVLKKLNPADLDWLKRKYAHMQELFEEAPFYQFILEKGRSEERQIALQGARQSLLEIVDARYASFDLPQLTRELMMQTEDHSALQHLIVQISLASTPEDAHAALLAWAKSNGLQRH